MKKPLLLLLSVFSLFCNAQNNLSGELLMFRNGDKLIKQQVEYKSPNPAGSNSVWDYRDLKTVNDDYLLSYSSLNDSVIQGTEHQTIYNYELNKDSLFLLSFENPTTQFIYVKPELLMHFPLVLGKKTTDYFLGTGNYCNRIGLISQGTNTCEVDADGTLILPTGDTLINVTRVHTSKRILETKIKIEELKSITTSAYSLDSINNLLQDGGTNMLLDTWKWYASGYRYPIFEIIESNIESSGKFIPHFKTAFYYAPVDQSYDLKNDYKNQIVRDHNLFIENKKSTQISLNTSEITDANYSLVLNKEEVVVNFNLPKSHNVSLRLFDLQGRQLSGVNNLILTGGIHQERIVLSNYPKGQYILQISIGDKLFGEKIIK